MLCPGFSESLRETHLFLSKVPFARYCFLSLASRREKETRVTKESGLNEIFLVEIFRDVPLMKENPEQVTFCVSVCYQSISLPLSRVFAEVDFPGEV